MWNIVTRHWASIVGSVLAGFGVLFLFIESYEVITNKEVNLNFAVFLALSIACGILYFILDGKVLTGFLKKQIELPSHLFSGETVTVKFGNFFDEVGWKSVAVNDFFDDLIDDVVISKSSIHGQVVSEFWANDVTDLRSQLDLSLQRYKPRNSPRSVGKSLRYPVGSTAVLKRRGESFIFFALGHTDIRSNETSATVSTLVEAVRGLLKTARTVCSGQPLVLPLVGSGLARVGIPEQAIAQIILTALLEESRDAKITSDICLVLPISCVGNISLNQILQQWTQK